MYHVTINTMNKTIQFITLLVALLASVVFAGCDYAPEEPYKFPGSQDGPGTSQEAGPTDTPDGGGSTQDSSTQEGGTQEKIHVAYTLPSGWKWENKSVGMAILEKRSFDKAMPFVKLDVCRFEKGTETDAKAGIMELVEQSKQECDASGEECVMPPVYKELDVAGTKMYAYMEKDYNNMGTIGWGSVMSFVKDGYVTCFWLNDKADLYPDLLNNLVKTLTITTTRHGERS